MGLNAEIRAKDQKATYHVRIGNHVLTKIESIAMDFDFDQASGICTIICPKKWSIEPNDHVEVDQGYSDFNRRRFTGHVDDVDKETFPKHMVVRCRDVLKRAIDNYIVDEIEYDSVQAEDIVKDLLERSGIYDYSLDTTNFTVGDVEPAKFSLITAFDAIRSIADLIGWRCWAETNGKVMFRKVYPRGAESYRWAYTKDPTFGSESGIIHIIHTGSDIDLRNWIEVWGWTNPSTGDTIKATAYADSQYVADPPRYRKAVISSELIDTQAMADWVAERVLGELNQLVDKVEATIQGNPKLHVGNTIRVVEDWTNMSDGLNYFIYGISSEMRADGLYQMTLDLRGGRYSEPTWPEGEDPIACFSVKQVGWGDPYWVAYVDASCSEDPDGEIVDYDWDWGDGSPHGSGMRANHIYSSGSPGGAFTIILTVTDDDALTGQCSKGITIGSSGSGVGVYDRILYFADGSARAYGSPDSGNTWNYFATSGACNQVAVNSADLDGYAWFGDADGKLYKSADYCVSGTLVYTFGAAITALWLNRVNDQDLLVGLSDGKVYRSLDQGASWLLLATFEGPVYWVLNYAFEAGHIWAGGGTTTGWLRESTDGGTSWIDHGSTFNLESVRDGCIHFLIHIGAACRTDPNPIRLSDDGGSSWTSPAGISDENLNTITADPYDENIKMAGGDAGLVAWLTTDGSSFSSSGSLGSGAKVLKLLIDQELYATVFGGTNDDLELSFDHGAVWKQLLDAPGDVNDIAQGPLVRRTKRGIWAYAAIADNHKVYFSPTGGKTWTTFPVNGLSNFGVFFRIVGHPEDIDTAYMTSYDAGNTIIRVWKTTDGNLSWAQVGTISGTYVYAKVLAIDPINPDILWVGASNGALQSCYIYRSPDGGQNWTQKHTNLKNVVALGCSPATPGRVVLALCGQFSPAEIYLTTNGGDGWSLVSSKGLDLFEGLRRGGIGFSPNGQRVVYRGGCDHPVSGGGARVAVSTDAGDTWSWSAGSVPRGENWDQNYPLKADVGLNQHTMFVLSIGATTGFYRSDDLGSTWTVKKTGDARMFVIADPCEVEVLWAIDIDGFDKSTDNGETWTEISNPGEDSNRFDDLSISGWQEVLI